MRRRLDATRVIPIENAPPPRQEVPTARTHAKRFAIGFTLFVLTGAVLLALPWATESGDSTPFVDALFTAISASSVTGLVTVDTQEHWNLLGEAIILLLIQVGGLGFMVGASLVLVSLRRGATLRDTLLLRDGTPTLSLREVTNLTRGILRFTLVCEGLGAAALSLRFAQDETPLVAIWHGIFHAISAFCNAGFDLQGGFRSLLDYDDSPLVTVTIMLLVQAGALSYMVLSDVWTRRSWNQLTLDTKLVLVTNAILLVIGAVGFLLSEWNNVLAEQSAVLRPLSATFQSVAARTAGFSTVNNADLNPSTLFLWIGLMMIGGAAGSTAGGVKLATVAVVILAVLATIRGQTEPQAFGRRIPVTLVFRAMAIIALFVLVHFVLTLALAVVEDQFYPGELGFVPLMYEMMSALATVGLSTGLTPALSDAGKLILCLAMFFGRLGPLTAVYALQRRQRPTRYRYPESSIRIG